MKSVAGALGALACLSACSSASDERPPLASAAPTDWRSIATPHDRERLREWRTAWVEALRKVDASGQRAAIVREGALLQPDAAVEWLEPPPGDYVCRVIKMGAKQPGLLDYVSYPAFNCRIRQEEGLMSFAKLTGSQRPIGHLLPYGGQQRMVFLGTLQLGDERRSLEYGEDRDRDIAGLLERIGERRWRLVMPYPTFESTIDILELVPRGS
jgi:hypothetical protein